MPYSSSAPFEWQNAPFMNPDGIWTNQYPSSPFTDGAGAG